MKRLRAALGDWFVPLFLCLLSFLQWLMHGPDRYP